MAEHSRRSARQRKVNPKYANDGWDKETLRVLRASSESSGSSPNEESGEHEQGPDVEDIESSSQESYNSSVPTDPRSQSSDGDPHSDKDDANMSLASDEEVRTGSKRRKRVHRPQASGAASSTAHSRGLQPAQFQKGKESIYPSTFGPSLDDLFDVLRARDTWLKGRDIIAPSRETLFFAFEQADALPQNDLEARPVLSTEDSTAPSGHMTNEAMEDSQILTALGQGDEPSSRYMPYQSQSHPVVLGAWGKQQKYELELGSVFDFGTAWPMDPEENGLEEGQSEESRPPLGRFHQGWLLNVGEKVQCLAWAPSNDSIQYLAISVRCLSSQRRLAPEAEADRAAFHPSPSYPSSIQIWAFQTVPTTYAGVRTLSMDEKPRLALVLGTEWGNIRHLKWNPYHLHAQAESNDAEAAGAVLGLLGVVSSDGHARIVAVPCPSRDNRSDSKAVRIVQARFDFPPPDDTVYTALAFVSLTDVILGAADGTVRVFDLNEPSRGGESPASYMNFRLHHSYIMSLCAASPGPFTTFIASTSASGDIALTDLRSPDQDQVHMPRACFPGRDLIYSPFTRSFITALDRAGNTHLEASSATFVVCHHLRQFTSSTKIARLPHQCGAATALAGSQWHPCILVGNARGQVLSTNYLRKVLPYRRVDSCKAVGAYMQKICEYDWRPLTPDEEEARTGVSAATAATAATATSTTEEESDLFHGRDTRPGVSRFQEGFMPEKIDVGNAPGAKRKAGKGEGGGHGEAIFEEEQAVTAMDWNPNRTCAGIAAVGWGSGMVRVQDLAHDLK